jgi:TolA-binding protein
MSDRPWLEDGDPALRVERSLLKRLNEQAPPAGSVDQGWAALAAEIPALHGGGLAGSSPVHAAHAAGGTGVVLAAKIVAGVAIAGGVLWGGSALLKPESASPSPHHELVIPAETPPAPRAPEAVTETSPEQAVAKPEPPMAPAHPASSATTLVEEGRLLAKAHELVQSGQSQDALEVLRLSQARYPRSVLYQEREVLTIEALAATGAASSAKQRAERFLKRYPNSPHAGRLQRFVE